MDKKSMQAKIEEIVQTQLEKESAQIQLEPIEKTFKTVLSTFDATSRSFEKQSVSLSLMAVGFLLFALPFTVNVLSGFIDNIRPFENGEYIASIICAMVLLLAGAGIRVYSWRINLLESAKLTESTMKILSDNLKVQKETQNEATDLRP